MDELNDGKKTYTLNNQRKRKAPINLNAVSEQHGKLPPKADDLEAAVLGAMMLEKAALSDVIDILSPEAFYDERHGRIFAAIQRLFNNTQPVDILTVVAELRKEGDLEICGGAYYISQLTNRVGSSANAEFHARIVIQKFIQRELIRVSSEIIRDAYEDTTDVFDLLDNAEANIFKVSEGLIGKEVQSMTNLLSQAVKDIEKAKNHGTGITGVESGFTELDRVTSGWQKQDLVILAARPGMGKTAFVLSLTRNAAVEFKRPIAVFSLEMSALQLVNRLIAAETELSVEKLKKGDLAEHEIQQLHTLSARLAEAPIYIDDTPGLSVFQLRAKARRLKAQYDIGMIIIDYLQLMTAGSENRGNREQEISTISRSLKTIAKELDVPIIALSQLSRAVETRGGSKRPQLSDLRESGAIEQDADMVCFIYRPEYYGIDADESGNPTNGLAEIIIAKHRNGALTTVPLRFIDRLAKFTDYSSANFGGFTPGPLETSYSAAINPNTGFDNGGGTMILPSKMNTDPLTPPPPPNDYQEPPFGSPGDEAPF